MKRLLALNLGILFGLVSCSKNPGDEVGRFDRGGVLPNPVGDTTPPGGAGNGMLGTMSTVQTYNQRPFSGQPGYPPAIPAATNQYLIGIGLTPVSGNIERFEVFARALYSDASLGPLVKFVNGTNTSESYQPSGTGWDFAFYNETYFTADPLRKFRVISGISFSNDAIKVAAASRTLGPGLAVSDAQYHSNASPWHSVSFLTLPDFTANVVGSVRKFFVLVGLYLKRSGGIPLRLTEILTSRLFYNSSGTPGQGSFRLDSPEMIRIQGAPGSFADNRPEVAQAIRVPASQN